jgi:hypothetical protein
MKFDFFTHLFPQIESLRTGILRKETVETIRYTLTEMDHLFFLHITDIIFKHIYKD